LSNAIKFTERGGIRLLVEAIEGTPVLPGIARIRFSVIDTGIGVKNENQATLFAPYMQEDQSTSRLYGGTGLGLAICKSIVELMGGVINLQSEPGSGSTFFFELELRITDAAAIATKSPALMDRESSTTFHGDGLTALVVDDDRINQLVAIRFLEELDMRVESAESGQDAIAMLARKKYDIVFMDCSMPGMDGQETVRRIRNRSARALNPNVTIIAMTAHSQASDREQCLLAGMQDYVIKPISAAAIKRVLDPLFPERASRGDSNSAETAVPGSRVFDTREFSTRYADDDSVAIEIIDLFLKQSQGLFDEGREALAKGDLDTFRARVHRLKGAAGTMGCERLVAAADAAHLACEHSQQNAQLTPEVVELAENFNRELGRALKAVVAYRDSIGTREK